MFMENYDLKQKDLTELGNTGVISEIMNRKQPLNIRHVKALAARFGCSPATPRIVNSRGVATLQQIYEKAKRRTSSLNQEHSLAFQR